jgi:biopolymer transport protein ExbD
MLLVPVASMADIAFLLIIFFVLCSSIVRDPAGIRIDPPTTPTVDSLDDYPMVVQVDADGQIYFQGKEVSGHEQVEEAVRTMVEGASDERARTVLLRCDRSVPKQVFEPVIEAIAKGGGRIAAVGEESKQ